MNYKHTCTVWLADELDPVFWLLSLLLLSPFLNIRDKRMAELYVFH